jgi:uncharacterized protein with FMN-binding domain
MFLCCLLVLPVLMTGCAKAEAEEKVLGTWNFEQGMGAFRADAYTNQVSNFTWEATEGVDGSGCVKIENTADNDARFVLDVDVLPNTYYKITAWVKTQGVTQDSNAIGGNISVLYTFDYGGGFLGDRDWTKVELYGQTAEDQKKITVCMRLGFYSGICTGTAWFDNLEVQQLAGKPTGVQVVSHAETPGLGAIAAANNAKGEAFRDQFAGTSGELVVGEDIDAITGATITSKAVTEGVNAALAYVKKLG